MIRSPSRVALFVLAIGVLIMMQVVVASDKAARTTDAKARAVRDADVLMRLLDIFQAFDDTQNARMLAAIARTVVAMEGHNLQLDLAERFQPADRGSMWPCDTL